MPLYLSRLRERSPRSARRVRGFFDLPIAASALTPTLSRKRERGKNHTAGIPMILRTMSMARRISVIEASSVRKAPCEESVTFSMPASG